jgi:hypothetical protein
VNIVWGISCEWSPTFGAPVRPRLQRCGPGRALHPGSPQIYFKFSGISHFMRHLSHVGIPWTFLSSSVGHTSPQMLHTSSWKFVSDHPSDVVLQVRYFRKLVESFSLCLLLCYMLLTISRRDECRHTSRAHRAREREKGNRKWKNGSRL